MNKFEDVDVITSLEAIMKQNTAFYQNDFDLDRNILQKAAASPTAGQAAFMVFPPVRDELLPGARRFSKRHKTA